MPIKRNIFADESSHSNGASPSELFAKISSHVGHSVLSPTKTQVWTDSPYVV